MFFTAIHQMMTEGVDLTLVIRKANGQLTVSLLPKSNGLKDEAQNHLVPLTVSGLPQELDACGCGAGSSISSNRLPLFIAFVCSATISSIFFWSCGLA